MKTRLNRIATTTGDDGSSALADGVRRSKGEMVFEVMGDIDELNVVLGICAKYLCATEENKIINWLQHKLFDFAGTIALGNDELDQERANTGKLLITPTDIRRLELWLAEYNKNLPPLAEFILPNGNLASINLHLARVVCRRAERNLCRLHEQKTVQKELLIFINRLSDLLFVISRVVSQKDKSNTSKVFKEEQWKNTREEI